MVNSNCTRLAPRYLFGRLIGVVLTSAALALPVAAIAASAGKSEQHPPNSHASDTAVAQYEAHHDGDLGHGEPFTPTGTASALITQYGVKNVSKVEQLGRPHAILVNQIGGRNELTALQTGHHQAAAVVQVGHGNRASLTQAGSNNRADLIQGGLFNQATIAQAGNYNRALVEQAGCGNRAYVEQATNAAQTVVRQYGAGGYAKVIQH